MTKTDNNTVIIHAMHESLYDQVVQPDRFIGVPKYFLRHVPHLGAELAWMYLAFRQAAYELGARKQGTAGRFSGSQITANSGIVPRTFWNRVAKAETWEKLAGLVQILRDPEVRWQADADGLRREPNQYAVSMTLPLTTPDAASLRTWLTLAAETHGADVALRLAAETSLDDLFRQAGDAGTTPQSTFTIVRELFAQEIPAPRLAHLATALHRHIMGSRLEISHFFARNVLPYLGTGPGLLWLLLRERADANGRVTISGGYAEMAGWLGLNRPMTVWEWLNGVITRKRQTNRKASSGMTRTGGREASPVGTLRNPILPLYLREISQGRAGQNFAHAPRSFEILMDDIPLAFLDFPAEIDLEELETWLIGQELFTRFAHPVHAVCTPLFTRFAQDIHAVCTVFKLTTPPHTFADAKEESADAENPSLSYPHSLGEAMAHPDIQLYHAITDSYPEQKDWGYTVDYLTSLRRRHPDLSETELGELGTKYFTEWSARNYAHTNPEWLHWWVNNYIVPAPRKRNSASSTKAARPVPAPVQIEPERELTPQELASSLAAAQAGRRYLESKGLLKPRLH